MADRIKGITIQLGGDTAGLDKALSKTNSHIKDTQSQLKDVERLLKLDPKNTELLRQKQKLLKTAVKETADKLKTLKTASEQAAETRKDYKKFQKEFEPIQAGIDQTSKELKELRDQMKKVADTKGPDSDEYKQLQQQAKLTQDELNAMKKHAKAVRQEFGNPISTEQYNALQREIVETENNLKSMKNEASFARKALDGIGDAAGKISDVTGRIAGATAPVTAGVVALGTAAFGAASDLEESLNKVNVAFGNSAPLVEQFAATSLESFGIARGSALDMAALFGDMGTSMGLTQGEAAEMAKSLVGLAGDLSSFKNIGLEQATTALNGIFTGETESLKTLGIVMNQTSLDAFALANGYKKEVKEMSELEKVQLRYAYVMNATKNAQGDFANTVDGAANSTRIMSESVKELTAEMGKQLLPIITPIIQKVTELLKWLGGLNDEQKATILTVLAVVAAISPVMGLLSGVAKGIQGVTMAIRFLSANPIFLIIAAIVALAAAVAVHGEEIKALLQSVDDFLKNIFAKDWTETFGPVLGGAMNDFLDHVEGTWKMVKGVLDGLIDFIQGGFSGDWERAWGGIKKIFTSICDAITGTIDAVKEKISSTVDAIFGSITSLANGINTTANIRINAPSRDNIPMLAKGGTVLHGQAIVGEAGPELLTVTPGGTRVQPMSSGEQARAAGITIQHMEINGYSAQDGEQLARDLDLALGRLYA